MRLIDAELYRAALEKTLAEMEKAGDSQTDIADGVRRALRMLDMQEESADAAPAVHGEWISRGNGFNWVFVCSVCKWVDGYPFNDRHSYCPACGAKMDGKDNT